MGRILFIEDDAALADVLALAIEDAGHEVTHARDGVAGLDRIARDKPDLVVSDVNMPRLDGFSLCKKLRAAGNHVPLILVTSRDAEIDQALGLELGADDYVIKPVSARVLVARIAALLRREALRTGGEIARNKLVAGPIAIDPERVEVRLHGAPVVVTLTELRILEVLCGRPGVVFSRDRILEIIRGDGSVVEARIVDSYVRRLRRKMEAVDPSFDRIETVVGAGYRWNDRAP